MWSLETQPPKKTKLKTGQEATDGNGGCSSFLTWFALVWISELGFKWHFLLEQGFVGVIIACIFISKQVSQTLVEVKL